MEKRAKEQRDGAGIIAKAETPVLQWNWKAGEGVKREMEAVQKWKGEVEVI